MLGELGLVVEELEMTRASTHEQEDDVLGGRSMMRPLRGQRVRGLHQLPQRDCPEADAALLQKPAAREGIGGGSQSLHWLLSRNGLV